MSQGTSDYSSARGMPVSDRCPWINFSSSKHSHFFDSHRTKSSANLRTFPILPFFSVPSASWCLQLWEVRGRRATPPASFEEALGFHHPMWILLAWKCSTFPSGWWRLAGRSEEARVGVSTGTWLLSINTRITASPRAGGLSPAF